MTEQLHFHFSLSWIGEGNGNPLQCSCLENPRDRGAWWAAVYRVAQGRTRLKSLSSSSSSSFLYGPTLTSIHDYWEKTIALTRWPFVGKVMSLLFNVLSRLVIAFIPRSKCLLISWLQSSSAVILEPNKIKSVTFYCFPFYLPGIGCSIWMWLYTFLFIHSHGKFSHTFALLILINLAPYSPHIPCWLSP